MKDIHVIANPASGDSELDLDSLSKIFRSHGVEWDVSYTRKQGDARRFAQEASERGADVVVAYGGDGTVGETASALIDTETPLGILPGGTANVLAMELGIPSDVGKAAELICGVDSRIDRIDAATVEDRVFVLRAGTGFEANMIQQADREEKNRYGFAAYLWSGLKSLRATDIADYRIGIDGETYECKGFTCAIANSGSLGIAGLRLGSTVSIRDGLLDVVVIEELNLRALTELLGEVFSDEALSGDAHTEAMHAYSDDIEGMLRHWQGRTISVEMQPAQVLQYDGEILDPLPLPFTCQVLAQRLHVVAPAESPHP